MVKFIGEEGFYPKWATKEGRWVAQWVLTSVRGFMSQTDELARPSVSYESLVWAPKAKNPLQLLRSSNPENSRALEELQSIPLACSRCYWRGHNPTIQLHYPERSPKDWRLRCPECDSVVAPELYHSVDWDKAQEFLLQRWIALGSPELDNPGASATLASVGAVSNLSQWITRISPRRTN